MKIMMKMLGVLGFLTMLVGDVSCSPANITQQLKDIGLFLESAPDSIRSDIRTVFKRLSANVDRYIKEKSNEGLEQLQKKLTRLLDRGVLDEERVLIRMELDVIRDALLIKINNDTNADELSELIKRSEGVKTPRFRKELERLVRINTMYSIPESDVQPEVDENKEESEQVSTDWVRSGR